MVGWWRESRAQEGPTIRRSWRLGRSTGAASRWNIASADARLGDSDSAFKHLRTALQASPQLAEAARTDDDFQSIQADPRFAELVGGA
jgi:hypothetical protein